LFNTGIFIADKLVLQFIYSWNAKELHMFVYGMIALLVVAIAVIGVQYVGYKNTLHDR